MNKSNHLNWSFLLVSLPFLHSLFFLLLGGSWRTWLSLRAEESLFKYNLYGGVKGYSLLCVSVPPHTCLAWQSTVSARPKECTHYHIWKNVLKPSENLLKLRLEAVLFFTCLFLSSCFLTIHVVNISDPEECFKWKPGQNKKMWLNLKVLQGKKCVVHYRKMPKHH